MTAPTVEIERIEIRSDHEYRGNEPVQKNLNKQSAWLLQFKPSIPLGSFEFWDRMNPLNNNSVDRRSVLDHILSFNKTPNVFRNWRGNRIHARAIHDFACTLNSHGINNGPAGNSQQLARYSAIHASPHNSA